MKMLIKDRYEKIEKLGEGTYGVVYKAVDHKPELQKPFSLSYEIPLGSTAKPSDPKILAESFKLLNTDTMVGKEVAGEESKAGSFVAIKKLRLFEVKIRNETG